MKDNRELSPGETEQAAARDAAKFDDQSVRELLAEAGRTWQVLQHDLDSQLRRPRA